MGSRKQALREMGIDAIEVSGSSLMRLPHTALFMPGPDDPEHGWAHDPRSLEEADPEMVRSMIERYETRQPNVNERAVTVLSELVKVGDAHRYIVHDGNRRTVSAYAAAEALRARKVLGKGEALTVLVEFYTPKDRAQFIADRIRLNRDPTRKPDTATVLAYRVSQLTQHRKTPAEIGALIGVKAGIVEALEVYERDTAASVRRRIDAGEIPIALLPEIQRKPKSEQEAHAATLIAAGVKTQKGATQRRNKAKDASDPWARRMSPRAMRDVSKAVTSANSKGDRYLEGVADALTLATLTGNDAAKHLDNMPRKVADLIRAARAPKGGAK